MTVAGLIDLYDRPTNIQRKLNLKMYKYILIYLHDSSEKPYIAGKPIASIQNSYVDTIFEKEPNSLSAHFSRISFLIS